MKNSKTFNMPVQGKGVPRLGTDTNYDANVQASFGILPIVRGIASGVASLL